MSRPKQKNPLDVCADCGAPDPGWASVNCGLLICDECCSIHRTLGRHISHIKSVRKSLWPASQLQMVKDLYTSGSNTIFEHTLVDSSSVGFAAVITNSIKNVRRKPAAKDSLHPTKADFIRMKYQNLAYINRANVGEDSQSDISEQLHSSVRTPNLKTSLRLLISGADPNYLHPEKGNTPLIMATKAGLISQVELLLVYGADPLLTDVKGKTPFDYASAASKAEIAKRILEGQYELTDRLSYFLCGRKPEHLSDQHFLIPEMVEGVDSSHTAKEAKGKLLSLPNRVFQEIAKDVYDEVDRREVEEMWFSIYGNSPERQSVPFLPVNPDFSAIRNQGRQKLARYNAKEFTTLVYNVLLDSKRRQLGLPHNLEAPANQAVSPAKSNLRNDVSDNESDRSYDSVASEEECDSESALEKLREKYKFKTSLNTNGVVPNNDNRFKTKYEFLESQLAKSDGLIQQLVLSNKDMHSEISRLQVMVHKLIDENAQLRAVVIPKAEATSAERSPSGPPPAILPRAPKTVVSRPQSMIERSVPYYPNKAPPTPPQVLPRDDSGIESNSYSSHLSNECRNADLETVLELDLPNKDDVILKTEQITKRIQQLLFVALDNKVDRFATCSENILSAVNEMVALFPKQNCGDAQLTESESSIFTSLHQLKESALILHSDCRSGTALNVELKQLTQRVIQCAYDVAKAAKQLVTLFTFT